MEIRPDLLAQDIVLKDHSFANISENQLNPNNGQVFNFHRKKIMGEIDVEKPLKTKKCNSCLKLYVERKYIDKRTNQNKSCTFRYRLTDFETTYKGIMKSIFTR